LQFQQDKQSFADGNGNATEQIAWQGTRQTGSSGGMIADFKALLLSALSGDAQSAQNAATALSDDLHNNSAAEGLITPQTTAATTTTALSRSASDNTFLNDLKTLIDAAQSGDQSGAQQAAQQVTQDIQNSAAGTSGTSGPSGHQHHHRHHGGGGDSADVDNSSSSVISNSASPVTVSSADSDALSTLGTSSTPGSSASDRQNSTPL
jgi:hypothetical protein